MRRRWRTRRATMGPPRGPCRTVTQVNPGPRRFGCAFRQARPASRSPMAQRPLQTRMAASRCRRITRCNLSASDASASRRRRRQRDVILAPEELAALTRRDRPSAQARVLRLLGIPFAAPPSAGVLLVSRAAAEKALGLAIERAIAEDFEVNVEGVRKHGQTSTAH